MVYEGQPEKPPPMNNEDRAPFWEGLGDKISDKLTEFEQEEVCVTCGICLLLRLVRLPYVTPLEYVHKHAFVALEAGLRMLMQLFCSLSACATYFFSSPQLVSVSVDPPPPHDPFAESQKSLSMSRSSVNPFHL